MTTVHRDIIFYNQIIFVISSFIIDIFLLVIYNTENRYIIG